MGSVYNELINVPKRRRNKANKANHDHDMPIMPQLSWRAALRSMFTIHNETGNIWSHFIGLWIQVALTVWFAIEDQGSRAMPKWPLMLYQLSDMFTLGASTTAHLLCCISPRVNAFVWKLDHMGIVVGLIGEAFPFCYYMFACSPRWVRLLYLSTSCVMGSALICLSWTTWFQLPKHRVLRPVMMSLMGVIRMVSMIHAMVLYRFSKTLPGLPGLPGLPLLLHFGSMFAFGVGTLIFAKRVPEKWFPGSFALFGNSHNIMHVFTLSGMLMVFFAGHILWTDIECH